VGGGAAVEIDCPHLDEGGTLEHANLTEDGRALTRVALEGQASAGAPPATEVHVAAVGTVPQAPDLTGSEGVDELLSGEEGRSCVPGAESEPDRAATLSHVVPASAIEMPFGNATRRATVADAIAIDRRRRT